VGRIDQQRSDGESLFIKIIKYCITIIGQLLYSVI
jgi:hypothetical protein